MTPRSISYSQVSAWRQCPQRWVYSYHDKITPKTRSTPLTFGSVMHSYLEHYYAAFIGDGAVDPVQAHQSALVLTHDEWDTKVEGYTKAARAAGDGDLADQLSALLSKAERIAQRYFEVRGRDDPAEVEVISTEQRVSAPLFYRDDGTAVTIPAVIDLVVRRRATNEIEIWDHKTTRRVPSVRSRMRDLQLMLYAMIYGMLRDIDISMVTWNYILSEEPSEPKLLKSGKYSKAKDQGTTRLVFEATLKKAGVPLDEYESILAYYGSRERDQFFQRFREPIVQTHLIIQELVNTARMIVDSAEKLERGEHANTVVRNVNFLCDNCDYVRLCTATITGGDTQELIERHYERRTPSPRPAGAPLGLEV